MVRIIIIVLCIVSNITLAASPPPRISNKQMVVSAHIYATQVGNDILNQGGNAIDAAVAIGYALSVVHPCCGNLGGGGFMVIRFADGKTTCFNFREKAPGKAKPELFLDAHGRVRGEYLSVDHVKGELAKPYLAVGVPGTVMGLNTALTKYGTMSLAKVIGPAIKLAQEGHIVIPGSARTYKNSEAAFKKEPNIAAIFLKNGHSYAAGDKLIQADLANTLKTIASEGTQGFYTGRIADEIVTASKQHGGVLTREDFSQYTIGELPPLECDYKNYHLITVPPPGSGVTVCQALKIVEPYPLGQLGFHSALGSHYILEALRAAYSDRNNYLGDPNFVKNPVSTLLSSEHILKVQHRLRPYAIPRREKKEWQDGITKEGHNTTSYAVIDNQGNAVCVTYTLNDYFGAKIIPGRTGFFLNNEMADFTIRPGIANNYGLYQGLPNLLAPKKRPLSSMAPTIITRNNQLYLVLGTPGGSTIPSTLVNVILNLTEYGMNIQEAIDMPRFHMQWLPDIVYMERFTFSEDTQAELYRMGYRFQLGSPYGLLFWGGVCGIMFDATNHLLFGGVDSRISTGNVE